MLLDLEEKTRVLVEDIVERSAIGSGASIRIRFIFQLRLLVELSEKLLVVKLVNEL